MLGLSLPGDRVVELLDFPIPKLKSNEALVRIKAAAICGSDLHHFNHKHDDATPRFIVGHEPCGVIEKLGDAVRGFEVGQRVALYHWAGCGHCVHCAKGEYKHCAERRGFGSPLSNGSDAEFMAVDAAQSLYPLPDNLSFEDGAMIACNAGTAYGALKKVGVDPTKTLCIYGLGPVGLATAIIARALGAKRIYGMDPNPERRSFAKANGVDVALDSSAAAVDELIALTGGGADCQIETSGSAKAQQSILKTAAKHGRISIVGMSGLYDQNLGVNLSDLINKELVVMGSHVMSRPEFIELIQLCSEKDIHFDSMITHRYPLREAEAALKEFSSGAVGKFIFTFD